MKTTTVLICAWRPVLLPLSVGAMIPNYVPDTMDGVVSNIAMSIKGPERPFQIEIWADDVNGFTCIIDGA